MIIIPEFETKVIQQLHIIQGVDSLYIADGHHRAEAACSLVKQYQVG